MQLVTVYDNGDKTFDRYTVVIGNDVFTMSENADQPDGVNQYCFDKKHLAKGFIAKQKTLTGDEIPEALRKAISIRMQS